MNKDEIGKVLDRLAVNCSRKWTSDKERELSIDNFYMGVGALTEKQIMTGFKKVIQTPNPFMPDVGTFRQLCATGEGSRNFDDEALNAWPTALKAIQRAGHWNSPVFKDSCIAEAIRKMGGWMQFCNMMVDEQPFRKMDFIDYYVVAKRQDKDFTPVLFGQYKDYKLIGYADDEDFKKLTSQIKRAEELERSITSTINNNIKVLNQSKG